ncbi:MAG: hypothetical protein U1F64_01420 [Burkholderiales bacterium]
MNHQPTPPTTTAMSLAVRPRASFAWVRVGSDGRNPGGLAPI